MRMHSKWHCYSITGGHGEQFGRNRAPFSFERRAKGLSRLFLLAP
jgi:hypothetical protein